MSIKSLRTKALALIECRERDDCNGCTWNGDEVCDEVYGKTSLIVAELIDKIDWLIEENAVKDEKIEQLDDDNAALDIMNEKLKEENAVLKERIAIMEVEREDDLK